MQPAMVPLACFLSLIRPPGIEFEDSLLQIYPIDKSKCPWMRDQNDVGFQLYTNHNPTVFQDLRVNDDEGLSSSHIDFSLPTVFYFHAFMENPNDGSASLVREAYLLRGGTNIIMVDAQRLEAGPWYFKAAENTWYIGQFTAQFIDYLVSRGLDLSRTHLVGHSLGAQAAGVCGAALKSGRVSRITGLDPASPLFNGLPLEQRLDPSDAEFVDVIHTDAGIFGAKESVGHVDFYPNGGISPQPGCELEVVLHQQLFLNKCDNSTQPLGFYTYHLKPHTENQTTLQKKPPTKKPTSPAKKTTKKPVSVKTNWLRPVLRTIPYLIRNVPMKSHVTKRQKRFISFFKRSEASESDNFVLKTLEFLFKNRRTVIPVFTVMREINTLVKSANGELNHLVKERNNYIGSPPPSSNPISYTLELGNESRMIAFVKRLLGMSPKGDRLTIGGTGK